uniref:Tripartite motif-containing protein 16-like n=1 Tax=Erpetoichthys calabaricus TaxID=27687 RepID=A0A8C4X4I3_ERPCA
MAEAHLFESQDEFTCSVCLDTVTDPITNPCGHSFYVECDACTGKKFRAVKSCLTCPASYCQTHLQPHFQIAAWKDHKLGDPDGNLKEKLCVKHQKSLEMFCETDDACICTMCGVTEHNGHKMVKLEMEREYKEVSGVTRFCIFILFIQIYVERDVDENEKSFTDVIRCIEEADSKLTEKIKELELKEMVKAEGVMEQLEKEIEDAAPDWFLLIVCVVLRPQSQTSSLVFFSLLSDFCPLTLDINTAHRCLHLSEGNKKVTYEGTRAKYPDHPDRFNCCVQVLCREALTGTRCYWEVECTGESLKIGVTYKGMSRKGWGLDCCLGYNDKSWCLWCYDSQYSVHHNHQRTVISAPYSPRIGVYLDWPAGSLSFYSVSHTMILLHRFNTSFTEPLYPGLYVGPDSSSCRSSLCL